MKKLLTLVVFLFAPLLLHAQTWQYTGSMNGVHWLSEMIALDNQTALMVGGFNENIQAVTTCEIYNPATAMWVSTGSLNVARAYPALIKLANGHILSMAGATDTYGSSTNVVENYDPATGIWTIVGKLNIARMAGTATLLQNGKVLVAGGLTSSGTTAMCELYDPSTNTSASTGSMIENRYVQQTVLLNDGTVFLTGGRDGGSASNYLNECEIYDPVSGTWSLAPSMFQHRTMGVIAHFSDNTVLTAGGRNTETTLAAGSEVFSPSSVLWQSTAPILEPVHWTAGVGFPEDRYMATGGIVEAPLTDPFGLDDITTSKCEWYDRTLQLWYFAPELNLSRCRHNMVYLHQTVNNDLPQELLLVAGGQMGSATLDSSGIHQYHAGFTNTAEVLDVTTSALKAYMKLPTNAGIASVRTVAGIDNNFKVYYQADASMGVVFTTPSSDIVTIEMMSVDGRLAKRIVNNQHVNGGEHTAIIQTNDLATGVYFIHYVTTTGHHIFKCNVIK